LHGTSHRVNGNGAAHYTPPCTISPTGIYYGQDGVGTDPRAQRGGNVPPLFFLGHWLRDKRLTFGSNAVELAPAYYDTYAGRFPIVEDTGDYEVIIVGSGLSGLSAAFYLTRARPGVRILLLDSNAQIGGNATRDDAAPIPVVASAGGIYGVEPQSDHQKELYTQVGLDWTQHYVPDPFYNYFFDEYTPHTLPGTRGWIRDVYGQGASALPYPAEIRRDLLRARQDFIDWYHRPGGPTDPADASDPQYDYLAQMTLYEYLTVAKDFHPAVADFYTRYTIDALAGTSQQVNAYTAISFLGTEYHPMQ